MKYLKYIKYLPMLINVLEQIKKASKDGKITVKEVWVIIESILDGLGIDVADRHVLKF